MRLTTYEFLVWLSVARPLAYATLVPYSDGLDYGKNSIRPDDEILNRADQAIVLYPPNDPSDRQSIINNVGRARRGEHTSPDDYPSCAYVVKDGVKTVVNIVYSAPGVHAPPVDMAPFIPEINAYADSQKMARFDEAWAKQIATNSAILQNKTMADAAEAARIQAIKAADTLKAAQDEAAKVASAKSVSEASFAQARAAELAAKAKSDLDRADFLAREAQSAIDYAARVNAEIKNANDSVNAQLAIAAANKAKIDALNAQQQADAAKKQAEIAHTGAIATTEQTNQTLVNNNLTPGEVSNSGSGWIYLLLAGAATYFIF